MKSFKFFVQILFLSLLFICSCRQLGTEENPHELIIEPPEEANNIQIIEPSFGNVFNPGDTLTIKWMAPTIQKIDIQLFRKTEFIIGITENLNNDGEYIWKIPNDFPLSHHYLIKIISHSNENIYNFSKQFGIL